jgi:16S rRNA (cytosine1402-N4)-methyltransferase
VDDAERGFSYVRDGPLDMRMDRTRGRTAADILGDIHVAELSKALHELGDETNADIIAAAIVAARKRGALRRTAELARVVADVVGQQSTREAGWRLRTPRGRWNLHPAARTFQALRLLVNRELANLQQLLRVVPCLLRPGGRVALISFHSGEDRLIKAAFREGLHTGLYQKVSPDPLRPTESEKLSNPRARSAKLRWAIRSAHDVVRGNHASI